MLTNRQASIFLLFWTNLANLSLSDPNPAPSSVVAFVGANYICNKIPGLTPHQRIMCQECPNAIVEINEGAHMGTEECHRQFRNDRWDCRSPSSKKSIFGIDQKLGTKEAAYDSAIRAAGVLHAIVTACGKGNLCDCGCDQTKRGYYTSSRTSHWRRKGHNGGAARRSRALQSWKWGGCSIDLDYGLKYSKKFLDAREIMRSDRELMNLHNYEAGRRAVSRNIKLECKCHGVSASCTTKTCWVTLPEFREVGNELKKVYGRARKVVAERGRVLHNHLIHMRRGRKTKPGKRELVYLHNSPTYCDRDEASGTFGTFGRNCNRTSTGHDNCEHLCCRRGYRTEESYQEWKCKCKFFWCCHVECMKCRERVEQYKCL